MLNLRSVTVYVEDAEGVDLESMIEDFLRSRGITVVEEDVALDAMEDYEMDQGN